MPKQTYPHKDRPSNASLTKESLIESLLAEFELPPLLDDDITPVRMAAKGIHKAGYWRTKLDALVDAGRLVKVETLNPATKHRTTAYRPVVK